MHQVVSMEMLPQWISLALKKASTIQNITKGFSVMGIYPLNADAMAKHLAPSEAFESKSGTKEGVMIASTKIAKTIQARQCNSMDEGKIHDSQHFVGVGCGLVPEGAPNFGRGGQANFAERPQNLPSNAANMTENIMNSRVEPPMLIAEFAVEPCEAIEHYFIVVDRVDDIAVEEIAAMDSNVENLESITTFLMLPTVAARAMSRRRDPTMDFTKSIILTSEAYVNALLEVRRARLAVAT